MGLPLRCTCTGDNQRLHGKVSEKVDLRFQLPNKSLTSLWMMHMQDKSAYKNLWKLNLIGTMTHRGYTGPYIQGKTIWISTNFSSEAIEPRRQWKNPFKVVKENNDYLKILCPANISFGEKG